MPLPAYIHPRYSPENASIKCFRKTRHKLHHNKLTPYKMTLEPEMNKYNQYINITSQTLVGKMIYWPFRSLGRILVQRLSFSYPACRGPGTEGVSRSLSSLTRTAGFEKRLQPPSVSFMAHLTRERRSGHVSHARPICNWKCENQTGVLLCEAKDLFGFDLPSR